jgi:L-rhamnose-H+ transport protein
MLLPVITTMATVPALGSVYHEAGAKIFTEVALFGAGWGIAQVLFGLAIDAIGIALAFSIVLGLSAAVGSLIPLISVHSEKVFTPAGLADIGGVILVIAGVSVSAIAGRQRERSQATAAARTSSSSFGLGLALAIISGTCAAFMNFGIAFGGPLISAAAHFGSKPQWTINAVWLPLMMAGAAPNLIYCVYLTRRNRSAGKFVQDSTGSYWVLTLIMAVLWLGSTLLYGIASTKLGALGPTVGWPLFMSLIVITASLLGVVTCEWENTGAKPLAIQLSGVVILIAAVVILSRASLYV